MTITNTPLEKESQDRYLTYALSVISGRALPDVRDGLKPVQRRILFAMRDYLNLTPERSHSKSAEVVGAVLAKLHPHGDIACYESMVRMAQDFSLRYPLVDGQGNFGSLDGDSAAAYRYTEVKLRPMAIEVIGEINEETVQFRDNFSSTTQEPVVFPSRVPNLIINGATGIAVGMATSIPPHNLRDTIKTLLLLLDEPDASDTKLASTIKGPDFPTACAILNSRKELNDIYLTGRGAIRMRGDWEVEEGSRGKRFIIVTSIPYAINKAQLIEKIADLIVQRKVPQLVDIRDESTDTIRIAIELASGASEEAAMAYLFKHTTLESQFNVNLTALAPTGPGGALRPEVLPLKACLSHFLGFREDVTRKKLEFEKKHLEERLHILEGFIIVYDALDEVIKIVRKSDGRSDAAQKLQKRFSLSEIQSFAIVDLRIYQLSRTNIDEIEAEFAAKRKRVKEIVAILSSRPKLLGLIRTDLERINETYGDKRLSKIVTEGAELEFRQEDYVIQEDVYAITTKDGWIKRIRQNNEVNQTRIREGDVILSALPLSTLDSVSFITNLGNLYVMKVADFPASSGYGEPLQKSLKFKDGERLIATFPLVASAERGATMPLKLDEGVKALFVSARGVGCISTLSDLQNIKRNGRRVYKPRGTDQLAAVCLLDEKNQKELVLVTGAAYGLRIPLADVPSRDGASVGVQLISVRDEDALVGAVLVGRGTMLTITTSANKDKDIHASDIVAGHRALKGNKVISRDEIVSIKLKEEEKK